MPTWAGVAYVSFIVDAYSRMIVGWRVTSHMRTQMVLDAVEMARWSRGTQLPGLRCHSDAGSQTALNWSSQHPDRRALSWDLATGRSRFVFTADRWARAGDRRSRGVRTG